MCGERVDLMVIVRSSCSTDEQSSRRLAIIGESRNVSGGNETVGIIRDKIVEIVSR